MIDELVNDNGDWLYLPNERCYLNTRNIHSVAMGHKIEHGKYKSYFNVDVSFNANNGRHTVTYYGKDASAIWEYAEDNKFQYKQPSKPEIVERCEPKAVSGTVADVMGSCGCKFEPKITEKCETKDLDDLGELFEISIDEDNKITLTFKSRNRN